jgi:hypothetical protein
VQVLGRQAGQAAMKKRLAARHELWEGVRAARSLTAWPTGASYAYLPDACAYPIDRKYDLLSMPERLVEAGLRRQRRLLSRRRGAVTRRSAAKKLPRLCQERSWNGGREVVTDRAICRGAPSRIGIFENIGAISVTIKNCRHESGVSENRAKKRST